MRRTRRTCEKARTTHRDHDAEDRADHEPLGQLAAGLGLSNARRKDQHPQAMRDAEDEEEGAHASKDSNRPGSVRPRSDETRLAGAGASI